MPDWKTPADFNKEFEALLHELMESKLIPDTKLSILSNAKSDVLRWEGILRQLAVRNLLTVRVYVRSREEADDMAMAILERSCVDDPGVMDHIDQPIFEDKDHLAFDYKGPFDAGLEFDLHMVPEVVNEEPSKEDAAFDDAAPEAKPEFPRYDIPVSPPDGNAFSVMGAVKKALKAHGVDAAEISKYTEEAMASNDYNHLLVVSMEWVDLQPS